MHDQTRLAIPCCGELLRSGNRYGTVAVDDPLHQSAIGLKPQRERYDIEQQRLITRPIPHQNICLTGRTHGDHLIGIQTAERLQPKTFRYRLSH